MIIGHGQGYYDRHGQQHSGRRQYLALFSWNRYKAAKEGQTQDVLCYPNGKPRLWAAVRSCALSQFGHFMMGTIRIGGKSITVSGPIGHDGLPLDLQDVPLTHHARLTEVPADIAALYWADDGHNDIGSARTALQQWAKETFHV